MSAMIDNDVSGKVGAIHSQEQTLPEIVEGLNPSGELMGLQKDYRGKLFVDAWGNRVHVHVDHDRDGLIHLRNKVIKDEVFVWSSGPNGISEQGDGDDIYYIGHEDRVVIGQQLKR